MEASSAQAPASDVTLSQLKELVIHIAKLKLKPEEISDHANLFDDCGIDSTSLVELVLSMEETYGISIPEEELEVTIFQDLCRLAQFIESRRSGATPA